RQLRADLRAANRLRAAVGRWPVDALPAGGCHHDGGGPRARDGDCARAARAQAARWVPARHPRLAAALLLGGTAAAPRGTGTRLQRRILRGDVGADDNRLHRSHWPRPAATVTQSLAPHAALDRPPPLPLAGARVA